MSTEDLVAEMTDLYLEWALTEERYALIPPRWQQLARELQKRHRKSGPGGCTCQDCCEGWSMHQFAEPQE